MSVLSAVNLTDDMCSIQIASLGSDLCQCGGTLLPLKLMVSHGDKKVKVKVAFCGEKKEQKVH